MSTELIILLATLAVVWIGILILRVPAFVAFFALLVGQLLSVELALNINTSEFMSMTILVLPLLLTVLLLKGRAPKSKLPMEFLPAFSVAVVLILFLYPMVDQLRIGIEIATNDRISDYRSWLLIVCSGLVLVTTLLNYPKPDHGKHK